MAIIRKIDTLGTKPLLKIGEFGMDMFPAGGDMGRIFIGTGTENIPLSSMVDAGLATSIGVSGQVLIEVPDATKTLVIIDDVHNTDYTIVDATHIELQTPLVGGEVIMTADTTIVEAIITKVNIEDDIIALSIALG